MTQYKMRFHREHERSFYSKRRARSEWRAKFSKLPVEDEERKRDEWITRVLNSADAFTILNTEEWGRRDIDDIDVRQAYRLKLERCYFD